jgi:hypothetical protein
MAQDNTEQNDVIIWGASAIEREAGLPDRTTSLSVVCCQRLASEGAGSQPKVSYAVR